ncbi:MAG: CHASE2 domain-containing protein [Cyclobacteriaceae bacterium]
MKRLLHSFIIVVITVGITMIVNLFMSMWIFHIAFPEQSALSDFEFEDFAFSIKKTNNQRDENIVLVNIGQLGRAGIAQQINILDRYKPKVIGVGVIFNCEGFYDTLNCPQLLDTLSNSLLHEAIRNSGRVVLISRILSIGVDGLVDSVEISDPIFSDFSQNGFGNLVTSSKNQDDIKSSRSFNPILKLHDKEVHAFAVELSRLADSAKTNRFLKRGNVEEIINYKGNISVKGAPFKSESEYFETLEYDDVLHERFDTTVITDRVVILGYFGDYLLDNRSEDMFYSPLNRVVLGKSLPDMYGMVVHANIVSMILREDYINRISAFNAWVLSILIVFFNALFFVWLHKRNTIWYEAFTLLIPALQIIMIAYFRHILFQRFNYVLDLSAATVLLVSVSLSAGLYFGPLQLVIKKIFPAHQHFKLGNGAKNGW